MRVCLMDDKGPRSLQEPEDCRVTTKSFRKSKFSRYKMPRTEKEKREEVKEKSFYFYLKLSEFVAHFNIELGPRLIKSLNSIDASVLIVFSYATESWIVCQFLYYLLGMNFESEYWKRFILLKESRKCRLIELGIEFGWFPVKRIVCSCFETVRRRT